MLTLPNSPARLTTLRGMPQILGASSPLVAIETRRTSSLRQRRVVRQAHQAFIIMIALQKGGVSKTETVTCLAVLLCLRGLRVLVIELDAQGDAAYSLGVDVERDDPTSLEVLHYANSGYGFRYALKPSPFGPWVIPANFRLSEHANLLTTATSRELLLARALVDDGIDEDFDVVLIDCPPAFGLPTMCAAAAAHTAEIPLQLHNRAWRALNYFESSLLNQVIGARLNPDLVLGGVMLTMQQKTARQSAELEAAAREEYGDRVYQTIIPFAAKAAEAPLSGQPVVIYDPKSAVALAYDALAEEMVTRYCLLTPKGA